MQIFSSGRVAELRAQGIAVGDLGRVEAGDVAGEAEVLAASSRRSRAGPGRGRSATMSSGSPMKIARSRSRGWRGDVLDHLGVVVGGEERLALAALGHRQHADEVGQPDVGRGLEPGVLVQEVVDLPGLVGDPEVEALVLHDVVEDHEVRAEDLVEPAQHLEGVELVLAGLGVDVSRLGGELGARGVDALAARLEHRRHRAAGRASRSRGRGGASRNSSRDRDVAPDVAEADRRADQERPRAPARVARRWRRDAGGSTRSANSRMSRLTSTG